MAVHHIVTRFRWMLAAGCDGSFSRSWRGLEQRLGTGRGLEAGGTYEPRVCSSLNELLAPPPVASRAAASRLRAAVYAPPPVAYAPPPPLLYFGRTGVDGRRG